MTSQARQNVRSDIGIMTSIFRLGSRTTKVRVGVESVVLDQPRWLHPAALQILSSKSALSPSLRKSIQHVPCWLTAFGKGGLRTTRFSSSTTNHSLGSSLWKRYQLSPELLASSTPCTAYSGPSQIRHFSKSGPWLRGEDAAPRDQTGKETSR